MAKATNRRRFDEWQNFISDLARVSLPNIAERCGVSVLRAGNSIKALCPFHDDHDPSLHFYINPQSSAERYKCFACGASGDVFDFVKKVRGCSFRDAVELIAHLQGMPIPTRARTERQAKPANVSGFEIAREAYARQTAREMERLADWGESRKFSQNALRTAEVYFASGNKLVTEFANDREAIDSLDAAGLIVRYPKRSRPSDNTQLLDAPPRDIFARDRVVFTLRNNEGAVVGFAGRAVDEADKSKYLFTRGLSKRTLLYGMHSVVERLISRTNMKKRRASPHPVFVHVVEGLTDVLRLQTLKFDAVAVLGSDVTIGQSSQLSQLASQCDQRRETLCVRLFLDADDAGWQGTLRSLVRVLKQALKNVPFVVQVVVPPRALSGNSGKDPDLLLRDLTPQLAAKAIDSWLYPPAHVLMAHALECAPSEIEEKWALATTTERFGALRNVGVLLPRDDWQRLIDLFGEDFFGRGDVGAQKHDASTSWQRRLYSYLVSAPIERSAANEIDASDSARLLFAMQLAQASTQRREIPTDELSWSRLLQGFHVTIPYIARLLGQAIVEVEPMVAIAIPKGAEGTRLKALPCPEQLTVQQYLLNELLRSYPDLAPGFSNLIPAVRYAADTGMSTTGPLELRPEHVARDVPVASFAYQIDMDVIEGRSEPRGDGMFRPYIDCWSAFVDFISRSVIRASRDGSDLRLFHVARLDVKAFYDVLPRFAVTDVLLPALRDAIKTFDPGSLFAPLFKPDLTNRAERPITIVDHLCDHSFAYSYLHPDNGIQKRATHDRGIPQGPDLSAYLATISLFPLDRRLVEEVATSTEAVTYARYVDDMVVIARSSSELARLRSLIQSLLRRIGLTLSPKTTPLPAMTATEVQNWLTENRGGLGASGIDAGPPVSLPPFPGDGGVDRREALVRLSDPALYHPATPAESVTAVIREVRECDELRFPDMRRVATLIWRNVAQDAQNIMLEPGRALTAPQMAAAFRALWSETSPNSEARKLRSEGASTPAKLRSPDLLVCLFGLERFLCSRRFLAPNLTHEEQRRVFGWRRWLAGAVNDGLCEELRRDSGSRVLHNGFSVKLLIANIVQIAESLKSPSGDSSGHYLEIINDASGNSNNESLSSPLIRFAISLSSARQTTAPIESLRSQSTDRDLHLLLHEAIARLSIRQSSEANETGTPLDPLDPMTERVKRIGHTETKADNYIARVLHWWIPSDGDSADDESPSDDEFYRRLIAGLLNVTTENAAPLLNRRQDLVAKALGGTLGNDTDWLPGVPVEHVQGIVGVAGNGTILRRVAFANLRQERPASSNLTTSEPLAFAPETLQWETLEASGVVYESASVAPQRYLRPLPDPDVIWRTPGIARWVANTFESLACLSDQHNECPPSALTLFGAPPGADAKQEARAFGYIVPRSQIAGQAFLKSNTHGLVPERVSEHFDHLWRIGFAITDWLGLVDKAASLPSQRLTSPYFREELTDDRKVDEYEWALESLLRFSLYRLCGKTALSSSGRVAFGRALPKSIERVLERLRMFPDKASDATRWTQLGIVLGARVETRFAAMRSGSSFSFDPQQRGAGTALLAQSMRAQVLFDTRLSALLPQPKAAQFLPRRRAVLAWYMLSLRIEALLDAIRLETGKEPDIALLAFSAGLRLTAIETQLRSQALELIFFNSDARRQLAAVSPDSVTVQSWNLDGTELFHEVSARVRRRAEAQEAFDAAAERGSGESEKERHSIETRNELDDAEKRDGVSFLFRAIELSTSAGNRRGWQELSRVTPLGWAVLVGTMAGALPSDLRLERQPTTKFTDEMSDELRDLAQDLALAAAIPKEVGQHSSRAEGPGWDPTWDDVSTVINTWTHARMEKAMSVLDAMDEHTGVSVLAPPPSRLYAAQASGSGTSTDAHDSFDYSVRLGDGTYSIRQWQIISASAFGERSSGSIEHTTDRDNRHWFRWTEARHGKRLLAIHVVQPGLAQLAGLESPPPDSLVDESLIIQAGAPPKQVGVPISLQEPIHAPVIPDEQRGSDEAPERPESRSDTRRLHTSLNDEPYFRKLRDEQERSWKFRSEKAGHHLRIAFVQWQIEDLGSYLHPVFDASVQSLKTRQRRVLDPKGKRITNPEFWRDAESANSPFLPSRIEKRRNEILRQVLRACKHFEVDCLLLPEYSTRPETAEFIRQVASDQELKTIVWAGTFRKPPYMIQRFAWLDDLPDWSAVLPVVVPRKSDICTHLPTIKEIERRCKKYPSIAYDELFSPSGDALKPILGASASSASCIVELICSEIFLATSPANLLGLGRSWCNLMNRFGSALSCNSKEVNEEVQNDMVWFGDATSMTKPRSDRRTILFVPAMTPRSVDYAVLGQASFLATGLTTVFCNDAGPHGHGQSCIIGHYGWDNEKDGVHSGVPNCGPYHGVIPGIYRPRHDHRGWLGQSEQAMVIADIDPTYQAGGQPRPQNLFPPMQLVAHLPILEVGSEQNHALKSPEISEIARRRNRLATAISNISAAEASSRKEVLRHVLRELCTILFPSKSRTTTIGDDNPGQTVDCLEILAHSVPENSQWLKLRADAYRREHAANPQSWPPPTLLDWLYVELDERADEAYPTIHVPKFARDPDG